MLSSHRILLSCAHFSFLFSACATFSYNLMGYNKSAAKLNTWTTDTIWDGAASDHTDFYPQCSETALASNLQEKISPPKCTEMGPVLDQLLVFFKHKFDLLACRARESTVMDMFCSIQNHENYCLSLEKGVRASEEQALPHWSGIDKAVTLLCAANDSLDQSCILSHFSDVKKCISTEVTLSLHLKGKSGGYRSMDPCSHIAMIVMCLHENMEPCDGETADVLTSVMGLYLGPRRCSLSAATTKQSDILMLLLILIVATVF